MTTKTAAPTVFPTATVPVFMQKTAETPPCQFTERVVNVPVTAHRQTPMIQKVQKTVEVPQIQFIDKFADAPVSVQAEGKKRKLPLQSKGRPSSGTAPPVMKRKTKGKHMLLCTSPSVTVPNSRRDPRENTREPQSGRWTTSCRR